MIKTAKEVLCLSFNHAKTSLIPSFLGPRRPFVSVRSNRSSNLAFRTTVVEDTHLTRAVIPFKVGANNSLIKIAITNIREKICRVSVPVQSIIPR